MTHAIIFVWGALAGYLCCRWCYQHQQRRLRREVELLRSKSELLKKAVNENQ